MGSLDGWKKTKLSTSPIQQYNWENKRMKGQQINTSLTSPKMASLRMHSNQKQGNVSMLCLCKTLIFLGH